jgi:hypothetical protein
MASTPIPESVVVAFTQITTLPEESFQEILSALGNTPLRIRQPRVFDHDAFQPKSISPEEAKAVADTLFPLYRTFASSNVDLKTFVNDLAQSLREGWPDRAEWLSSDDAIRRFKERITQLLSVDSLRLIAKAHEVLLQHENTFLEARILSDIRPVFGEDVQAPPEAMVLIHMLNIEHYDANNERREFVVALDVEDIRLMVETLKRAEAKTKSLKSLIDSTKIPYIDVV